MPILDLHDQIDALRELLAAAIGDRDRARDIAVHLEQECAALTEALRAVTHEYEPDADFHARCKHCCSPQTAHVHRTPEQIRGEQDETSEAAREAFTGKRIHGQLNLALADAKIRNGRDGA